MKDASEQLKIGQRVRVIAESMVHYRQVGTVVAPGQTNDWYVHLDYDTADPDLRILFHSEELELVSEAPQAR